MHQRGIGSDDRASKNTGSAWQSGTALARYLSENNINVEHAPLGMSRQKTNQTRAVKSGIMWTVQWIDESGEQTVQNNCLASLSLAEIYSILRAETRNAQKRRRRGEENDAGRGLKRKREQSIKESNSKPHRVCETQQAEIERIDVKDSRNPSRDLKTANDENKKSSQDTKDAVTARDPVADHNIQEDSAIATQPRDDLPPDHTLSPEASSHVDDGTEAERNLSSMGLQHERPPSPRSPTPTALQVETSSKYNQKRSSDRYFYLLKPATTSASRVLIPLESSTTLTKSLQNRTVLEYPTIYVLSDCPESLRSGFLLESNYQKSRAAKDRTIFGQSNIGQHPNALDERLQHHDQASSDTLDAKSILEMLKRDITY